MEEEGCKTNSSWRHPADLWPTEVTVLALATFRPSQKPALQSNTCPGSPKAKDLHPKPENRNDLLQCISVQFSLLKGRLYFSLTMVTLFSHYLTSGHPSTLL